jgi:hypothetical protein
VVCALIGRGRRLGRQARHISTYCNNDGDLLTHEIIGKPRQAIVLIVNPTIVDASDVLTLEKTSFIQTLTNERETTGERLLSSPIIGRAPCCALAAGGHAAAAPPKSATNSRRSFDHLVGASEQPQRG